MGVCIICRKEKDKFNDEHVFPDSIGGYYHIKTVCTDCNSRLGTTVDNRLTNHVFIEFKRHALELKGKKGRIPNPLEGIHTIKSDSEQKVLLKTDNDGELRPILVPKFKTDPLNPSNFSLALDKSDEGKAKDIIAKYAKRNQIPSNQINYETTETSEFPLLSATLKIDIKAFRIALLKIAYEFTVDQVPSYFNDVMAVRIAEVLCSGNDDDLIEKITMIGNGFEKEFFSPLEPFLSLDDLSHYVILHESNHGLLCLVRIFDTFTMGFLMSETKGFLVQNILIGHNDIRGKRFEVFNSTEMIKRTFGSPVFSFEYVFKDSAELMEFNALQEDPSFCFYMDDYGIPLFDIYGIVKYPHVKMKSDQPHLEIAESVITKERTVTHLIMDEYLFVKIMPWNKLVQITGIREIMYRKKSV